MAGDDIASDDDILDRIRDQVRDENIRLTQHAQQEIVEEDIALDEVFEAVAQSQLLENYPQHRRGACCLISGLTRMGRPIHIVCTTEQPTLVIITVYLPKSPKWITPTQRRS
jgi:hypothetical protein